MSKKINNSAQTNGEKKQENKKSNTNNEKIPAGYEFNIKILAFTDAKADEPRYFVQIYNNAGMMIMNFRIKDILNNTKCLYRLGDYGYVDEEIIAYIYHNVKQLHIKKDYTQVHQTIGFGYLNDKKVFFGSEVAGAKTDSKYMGKLPIEQKGNMQGYAEGIKNIILGKSGLELAVILGFCGVVMEELNKNDMNIIINFKGKTSTGKSTGTHLSLSAFGKAEELLQTCNNTDNRLMQHLKNYYIIPMVADDKIRDMTSTDRRNAVNYIFNMASGQDRGRYSRKENITYGREYFCPIISSTEISLVDLVIDTEVKGQITRFIEIDCDETPLTDSAAHCDKIYNFVREQYGVVGMEFAHQMIKEELFDSKLNNKVEAWQMKIADKIGIENMGNRMSKPISIIMTVGEILNDVLKPYSVQFDLSAVEELLIKNVTTTLKKLKEPTDSYTILMGDVNNRSNLYKASATEYQAGIDMGALVEENNIKWVLLPKDNFNKIIPGNERVILREWKRCSLIDALPDNHMARRRVIGKKSEYVYKIKISEETHKNT